jgi:hypothetical protein
MALGILLLASPASAQCRPPANSHEARLVAFYEAPIMFSMAAAPERLAFGAVRIGGEGIPVPSPDRALKEPEYCYANSTNNTKLASIFGRPRLTIGLPAGLAFEASYLPKITVAGAQANLASVALSRTQGLPFAGERYALAFRAHLTAGQVRGSITCSRASLQTTDATAPCYGSEPSYDTFHPNSFGFEGAVGVRSRGGRIAAYAGGGVSSLRPRFRVGFTDALGNVDRTAVDVDLVRGVAFGGATARLLGGIALSAQVYAVPVDVTTIRVAAQYSLR